MAQITSDFVKETSSVTGTGAATLLGARNPARAFSTVLANSDTCHYSISHTGAFNEWEVGLGTYTTAGNTLTRTTVLSSSNANAAVSFSAGTKNVDLVAPASRFALLLDGDKGDITVGGTATTLTIDAGAVTNAKIATNTIDATTQAQMATFTTKGNNTTATANEVNTTALQHAEYTSGGVLTLTTAQTQTASVTNVTAGTYTIPANFAIAGSEYGFEAWLYTGRGATTTATNVIIELLVNGTAVRTVTLAINVATNINRQIQVEGKITIRTIGAGGTMLVSLRTLDDCVAAAAGVAAMTLNPAPSATSPATTAIDTTVTRSLELRARLSATTATCYVHMTHCTISKTR